jgi:hypothetical protein
VKKLRVDGFKQRCSSAPIAVYSIQDSEYTCLNAFQTGLELALKDDGHFDTCTVILDDCTIGVVNCGDYSDDTLLRLHDAFSHVVNSRTSSHFD